MTLTYYAIRLKEASKRKIIQEASLVTPDTSSADVYGTPFKGYVDRLKSSEDLYYYGTLTSMGEQYFVFPWLFTRPKKLLERREKVERQFNRIDREINSRSDWYKNHTVISKYSQEDLEIVEFELVEA